MLFWDIWWFIDLSSSVGLMANLSRSAGVAGFADVVREAGADPYKFAAKAGVPPKALTDPDLRVPAGAMWALMELTAEELRLDDLGVRIAERRKLSNLGAIGLALRDQPTLRAAIDLIRKYLWLQTDTYTLHLEEAGDIAILHLHTGRWSGSRQALELALGVTCVNFRALVGEAWRPLEVRLMHRRPRRVESQTRVFGVMPLYDQDFIGVVMRRSDLSLPVLGADPVMGKQALHYLQQLASRRSGTFREKIRHEIAHALPTGLCSVERLAHQLGVDRRTLHRRLAAERTTFTELVEDVRAERVEALLAKSDRSVQRIAEDLGFSGLSAFAHWFRRRYGRSATDYRQHALAGEAEGPFEGLVV